ncbi:MAG: hypothetical protein FWG07_07885 [Treponema sp.]|nr:hypothetical protein [Treponema sp.]
MKKQILIRFNGILLFCFVITACGGGGDNYDLFFLSDYQKIGAGIAAKTYIPGVYDCSNFSVHFYQESNKAGLPCRVRIGDAGGKGFSGGMHAWNSVLINRQWVDWEPQYNDIHYGHTKTSNHYYTNGYGGYTWEELERIMYELIGRTAPSSLIDAYEIDKYLFGRAENGDPTNENSPFHYYFGGLRFGVDVFLSDYTLSYFQVALPNKGRGLFYITTADMKMHFVYRVNDNFYVVADLRSLDPVEGRSVIKDEVDFSGEGTFLPIDPSLWPEL